MTEPSPVTDQPTSLTPEEREILRGLGQGQVVPAVERILAARRLVSPPSTTREEIRLVAENGQTSRTNEDTASRVNAEWSINLSPVVAIERRTVRESVTATEWARVPVPRGQWPQ